MRPEQRDKILALADQATQSLGSSSYEEGMEKAYKLFSVFTELVDKIRTREKLAQELENAQPSWKDELLIAAVFRLSPHLIRFGLGKLSALAEKTLPDAPTGRPAMSSEDQIRMLHFMDDLHFRKGVGLDFSKLRASQRFGVSIRTVERYWTKRREILENGPEMQMRDVIEALNRLPD